MQNLKKKKKRFRNCKKKLVKVVNLTVSKPMTKLNPSINNSETIMAQGKTVRTDYQTKLHYFHNSTFDNRSPVRHYVFRTHDVIDWLAEISPRATIFFSPTNITALVQFIPRVMSTRQSHVTKPKPY